jgi:hypothetical protein
VANLRYRIAVEFAIGYLTEADKVYSATLTREAQQNCPNTHSVAVRRRVGKRRRQDNDFLGPYFCPAVFDGKLEPGNCCVLKIVHAYITFSPFETRPASQ